MNMTEEVTKETAEENPLHKLAMEKFEKYGKVEYRLKGCGDKIYKAGAISTLKKDMKSKVYPIVEVL
jgi:hypothetical protein